MYDLGISLPGAGKPFIPLIYYTYSLQDSSRSSIPLKSNQLKPWHNIVLRSKSISAWVDAPIIGCLRRQPVASYPARFGKSTCELHLASPVSFKSSIPRPNRHLFGYRIAARLLKVSGGSGTYLVVPLFSSSYKSRAFPPTNTEHRRNPMMSSR